VDPAETPRSSWPVRVFRLGSEPGDDLSGSTTAQQRIAMMWPLAREAWALSGRPLPSYERRAAPVAVRSLGDPPLAVSPD